MSKKSEPSGLLKLGEDSWEGVQYRLKPVTKHLLKAGEERTAKVQIVPRRNVAENELMRKVAENSVLKESTVRYVCENLIQVIMKELRAGNTVSLDNCFLFGVSMPGRLSPLAPLDARKLKLVPTVRFSPSFHRALNHKTSLNYLSHYQPTEVRVDELRSLGSICTAYGRFHNLHTLKVEMIIGETVVPCRFELRKDKRSTRDLGKALDIIPVKLPPPPPPGRRQVRFTYVESTGAIKSFVVDAVDIG